jgi:hypothetical protein
MVSMGNEKNILGIKICHFNMARMTAVGNV